MLQLGAYLISPHVRCFEYMPYRCFRSQPNLVGSMLTSSARQEYGNSHTKCKCRFFNKVASPGAIAMELQFQSVRGIFHAGFSQRSVASEFFSSCRHP